MGGPQSFSCPPEHRPPQVALHCGDSVGGQRFRERAAIGKAGCRLIADGAPARSLLACGTRDDDPKEGEFLKNLAPGVGVHPRRTPRSDPDRMRMGSKSRLMPTSARPSRPAGAGSGAGCHPGEHRPPVPRLNRTR